MTKKQDDHNTSEKAIMRRSSEPRRDEDCDSWAAGEASCQGWHLSWTREEGGLQK